MFFCHFDDFFGRFVAHHTVFSVACINNSDSEILAALQITALETILVRTQRHRLDADKVPMLSGGLSWQGGFCRDSDPS